MISETSRDKRWEEYLEYNMRVLIRITSTDKILQWHSTTCSETVEDVMNIDKHQEILKEHWEEIGMV